MGSVLYRLDPGIRVEGSHSRAIANIVEQEWRNAHPEEPIIRRDVGVDPIPATASAAAVFAGGTPEEARVEEQKAALALAATLTEEADVWNLDLEVGGTEFTLVGVNPALDQFKELADDLRAESRQRAQRGGRQLGAAVARTSSFQAGTSRRMFGVDEYAP
jgi:hypothetical protein